MKVFFESNRFSESDSLRHFCKSALRNSLLKLNYYSGNYRDIVWLLGDGRSGTTWVSSLINYRKHYREMFEPIHPHTRGIEGSYLTNRYIRPNNLNDFASRNLKDIFSGKLTDSRVDRQNNRLLYKGILVKDIYANLFAYWATRLFEEVKVIFNQESFFRSFLKGQKKLVLV